MYNTYFTYNTYYTFISIIKLVKICGNFFPKHWISITQYIWNNHTLQQRQWIALLTAAVLLVVGGTRHIDDTTLASYGGRLNHVVGQEVRQQERSYNRIPSCFTQ